MSTWLLVHPPLLGPVALRPLGRELRSRGHAVALPDLRAAVAVAAGWPDRVVAACEPAEVVLGFSGAGVVLPAVAAAVGARRVVWLDAVVPDRAGATLASAEHRARVAGLVHEGRIAEWTTWWGPDWAQILPDAAVRAAIEAEGHRLPGDFYEVAVPVPARWPEDGAAYVQLSEAYDDAAAEARSRGWPVTGRRDGAHLDVVTDPSGVADLVLRAASPP